MNQPWGMSGPRFLAVFGAGLALTAFAPLLLRLLLGRVPAGRLTRHLDAYEVGYLAGGPDRAADVVITELVTSGALRVDSSGRVTTADLAALNTRSGLLASGIAAAGSSGPLSSMLGSLPELRLALAPKVYKLRKRLARTQASAAIGTRLRAEQLFISKARVNLIRGVSLALWATLFVAGFLRLNEGAHNHRPTGNLSALLTLALIIFVFSLFLLAGKLSRARTSLGSQMLKKARAAHGDGSIGAGSTEFAVSGAGGTGFAVASGAVLFGVALTGFAAVEDETLRTALLAGMPDTSSSGDGGGCGGGGCGGGGCGG
jgi:uncharacterized protein (TIGR04222 family)